MASHEHAAVHRLFMTAQPQDDENRLVAIRSTASALRKEEEELVQRLKEKAVLGKLENKLEKYISRVETAEQPAASVKSDRDAAVKERKDEEAAFKQRLLRAQKEIEAISARHSNLAAELAFRDGALTDCQTRNTGLMAELVSYRAQCHELAGANAAFREQHEAQAIRAARMFHRLRSLEHHSRTQEATICALLQEVQTLKGDWAKGMRVPPPNMHGPVGGPNCKDFIPSYAPGYGSNTHPVPTCGPMPSYGPNHTPGYGPYPMPGYGPYPMPGYAIQQLPAEQPQLADGMEQDEEHSSPSASDAAQSGASFHTAHASECSQATANSEAVVEEAPELAKEFSFGDSLQEPLLEPAFVSKLEKKDADVCDSGTEAGGATVRALHCGNLTLTPVTSSNPPVQAGRGVDTAKAGQQRQEANAATDADDNGVAPVTSSTIVQTTAAAEAPTAPPPPPPRKLVYVTPVLPQHLATLSSGEQRLHKEALHRVSLPHPPASPSPAQAGVYVTPLPTQPYNSSTSSQQVTAKQCPAYEVLERRANRRTAARASRIGRDATQPQHTDGASCQSQQAGASSVESTEATAPDLRSKHAKKKARKNRAKKASKNPATAGN